MKQQVENFLKTCKKKNIHLDEIKTAMQGIAEPSCFVAAMQELVEQGVLEANNSSGSQHIGGALLSNTYKIRRARLEQTHRQRILQFQQGAAAEISVLSYLSLPEPCWHADWPYIDMINRHLSDNPLPENVMTAPECSYVFTGDEKWIDGKGGRKVLERLGLWDKLHVERDPEPLMLAVNPGMITNAVHMHMIVENKSTYFAMLGTLAQTQFTSLIYGAGWKVASNIRLAPVQLGLPKGEHVFYYFGDIDHEGISIWHAVFDAVGAIPALPLYLALQKCQPSLGKTGQAINSIALREFQDFFLPHDAAELASLLAVGRYIPQEALEKQMLCTLWRDREWKSR